MSPAAFMPSAAVSPNRPRKFPMIRSRIDSPQITGVTVDWNGVGSARPAEIPPIFDGDLLRVSAGARPTAENGDAELYDIGWAVAEPRRKIRKSRLSG